MDHEGKHQRDQSHVQDRPRPEREDHDAVRDATGVSGGGQVVQAGVAAPDPVDLAVGRRG